MKTCVFLAGLLALGLAHAATAQDEPQHIPPEQVQGNYHGTFSGAAWEDQTVRAEVAALSDKMFRAVFHIGVDGDMDRVEVKGRTRDFVVDFEEDVELSGARKGTFSIAGSIEDGVFSGAIKGGGLEAPFELEKVLLQPPTLGATPPKGAIVLMDGTHLDHWVRVPEKWCMVEDGAMQVCSSSLRTVEEFGSGTWHVEFRTPFMPHARGQARGNSGVYVFGRYEIQVLDSFGDLPADNLCGGIYKEAAPIVNATLPPLEWQTYDITFDAPEFDANGNKIKDAVITVYHNGVLIHDAVELSGSTPGGLTDKEGVTGALLLQHHGDPVRFRNIWFVPKG